MNHEHRHERCANCGHTLGGEPPPNYCPACGQETTLHPPSLMEFVHEFAAHYVALEGELWRSLVALLLRPGKLTLEYFAGRRRRYVLPLRLYLTASFVFFLVVKVFGAGDTLAFSFAGATPPPGTQAVKIDDSDRQRMEACASPASACDWWDSQFARFTLKAASQADKPQAIAQRMGAMAPYAIFALLPFFAGLLKFVFLGRSMPYGGHVVFSLHVHAFWFFALLAMALLPSAASGWIWLLMIGYGAWALRTVYATGPWGTLWRGTVIVIGYAMLLVGASAALAVAALLLS